MLDIEYVTVVWLRYAVCVSQGKPSICFVSFSWVWSVKNSMASQLWWYFYRTLVFILDYSVAVWSPIICYLWFIIVVRVNWEQSSEYAISTFITIWVKFFYSCIAFYLLVFRLFGIDLLWSLVFLSYEFKHPLVFIIHGGMILYLYYCLLLDTF